MEPRTIKSLATGCGCSVTGGCGCFILATVVLIAIAGISHEVFEIREWWTREKNALTWGPVGGGILGLLAAIAAFFLGAWLAGKYVFKQ